VNQKLLGLSTILSAAVLLFSGCARTEYLTVTSVSTSTVVSNKTLTIENKITETQIITKSAQTITVTAGGSQPATTVTVTTTVTGSQTTSTAPQSNGNVSISYSGTTVSEIGNGVWIDTPDEGNIFLIVTLTIQNQGYSSFPVGTSYFVVHLGGIQYHDAFVTELDEEFPYVEVLDGGSITGKIAFEIPSSASYQDFVLVYDHDDSFNIQWNKQ
jgi:hypothetical protein